MPEHRLDAHAAIRHGKCAARVDGGRVQVLRVALTDAGPIIGEDGTEQRRSDVVCSLKPIDAMKLALRLLELAHEARGARS